MIKKYHQIVSWIKTQLRHITPGYNAIKGAAIGLLLITGILWLTFSISVFTNVRDHWILLFFLVFALIAILFGFISRWVIKQLGNLPKLYKLALLITLPLLFTLSFDWILPILIISIASLCGAAIMVLSQTGFKNLSLVKKVVTLLGVIIGFGGFIMLGFLYSKSGFDVSPIINAANYSEPNILPITASSPAQKGTYPIKTMTYGSGEDRHRPEFGTNVDFKTDSVNGLPFIDNWEGFSGYWREKYWGFNSKALPLNARVWYPDGDGTFPLVLVVHGNHGMQDYSDPGYEYLGKLLASKGIIMASVDENFINGSWSDIFGGLDEENDARGWLLLEHLKLFHDWNKTDGHLFNNKIDINNIALIGHSRGGEAVAHAAMFNKLPFYPDDASIKFDYNYNIKSIVAIAPVDGQYKPGDSKTQIEDINYFVIHGAQDADVSSYMGSQQYERITFKDSLYHFKSGLYVYGANHGQFNSTWGNNDSSNPFTGLLNLKQLMSFEDQITIAKVYIGAFLDATLKNKTEYIPLFLDARKGKDWLPETIYLSQFEDSSFKPMSNFDEDFDLSTITQNKSTVKTKNLSVWREQEVKLKWQQKGTRALFVGWHYDLEESEKSVETLADSIIAKYTINLPKVAIDSSSVLVFSMAESNESSKPKSEGKWVENINTNDNGNEEDDDTEDKLEDNDEEDEEIAETPIDFTIQLSDSNGEKITFQLSNFMPLQRTIDIMITKTGFLKDDMQSEMIFQTFYFPLEEITKANSNFDCFSVKTLDFIFDKNDSGVIAIDNIGFMKKL